VIIIMIHTNSKYKFVSLSILVLIILCNIIGFYRFAVDETSNRVNVSRRQLKTTDHSITVHSFKLWNRDELPFPCVSEESPDTQGIFLVKDSSTTSAYVTTRIAAKESMRQNFLNGLYCKTHYPMVAKSATELKCKERDKKKSILWAVIRHPNNYAISNFSMKAKFGESTSDENFSLVLDALDTNTQLRMVNPSSDKDPKIVNIPSIIQNILDEYNFIGLHERLHESLIVFSMLMGLNINDVLYNFTPQKDEKKERLCGNAILPTWFTLQKKAFLQSRDWITNQLGDFMLYKTVNDVLDMTIDMLGREKVKRNVLIYEHLLSIGSSLSNNLMQKEGCGVLFPTPYSDIDSLENFKYLKDAPKSFVLQNKNLLLKTNGL